VIANKAGDQSATMCRLILVCTGRLNYMVVKKDNLKNYRSILCIDTIKEVK
jgi:hypothetical protein